MRVGSRGWRVRLLALAGAGIVFAAGDVTEAGSAARPLEAAGKTAAWLADTAGYQKAQQLQKATGKPMVVYFYADWCGQCKQFDRGVLSSTEYQPYAKDMIQVKINPEHGKSEDDISVKYGVREYPSYYVVTAAGKVQRVHPFVKYQGRTFLSSPEAFVRACNAAK